MEALARVAGAILVAVLLQPEGALGISQYGEPDEQCSVMPHDLGEEGQALLATGSMVKPGAVVSGDPLALELPEGHTNDLLEEDNSAEEEAWPKELPELPDSDLEALLEEDSAEEEAWPKELPELPDSDLEALLEEDSAEARQGTAEAQGKGIAELLAAAWRPGDPFCCASLCLDVFMIVVLADLFRRWRARQVAAMPVVGTGTLREAVVAGDAECCRKLLSAGGVSCKVEDADVWGCTLLHLAADSGSSTITKMLLESGANVDATEAWDQTPLHFAARKGHVKVCERLLASGASLNAQDAQNWTPLLSAAHGKQEATCELLLRHGADTGGVPEGEMPPVLTSLLVRRVMCHHGAGKDSTKARGDAAGAKSKMERMN